MEKRILYNKYVLEEQIAQGGMSSVYICTSIQLGNKWIAKHIASKYADRIYEESILKRLNHLNLPKIIDVCRDETGIYIIQSYIEGDSLQQKLERHGSIGPDKIIEYALQLCEVLIYLHNMKPKPIVHRDIKPSNIIITAYDRLVLIDFGISEEVGGERLSYKAATNAYASPEQLLSHNCDTRSDIYSLGIVIYQMLTGQLPGRAENLVKNKQTPVCKELLAISDCCSQFQQDDRYQYVEEIKKDLLKVRNIDILIKEKSKRHRKRAIILMIAASLLNYICLMLGILYKG